MADEEVSLVSRYGDLIELEKMRAFVAETKSLGLDHWLRELYYDSKACVCFIKTHPGLEDDAAAVAGLWAAATQHIAQFELMDVIGHGRPEPTEAAD